MDSEPPGRSPYSPLISEEPANAELTEAHVGFTEAIDRLEPFIDSSIENDFILNLTLLRAHTDLIAARQRLQDLDRVRTRPSSEPSEPIFHMGMEF